MLLGGVPAQGVYLPGGTCSGGCTCPGGVPAQGVYLSGGGCTCPDTPPLWTEFLTRTTENITLPQTSFTGGNKPLYKNVVQTWLNKTYFSAKTVTKLTSLDRSPQLNADPSRPLCRACIPIILQILFTETELERLDTWNVLLSPANEVAGR